MMTTGILCGLAAALLNSFGYLFGARFLLHYKSPMRLLVCSSVLMMAMSIPFLFFVFPFRSILQPGTYVLTILFWICSYILGQGCFFLALRFFEASRLSSLLGLKIIVLAVLFIFISHRNLKAGQWIAVVLAAIAAMGFNWSGGTKPDPRGWLVLLLVLIGYSFCDLNETKMIQLVMESGFSVTRGTLAANFLAYSVLGVIALPFLAVLKPTKKQFILAFPNALFWLASQFLLTACFAFVLPVFGNVILATRGIFSVVLGGLLSLMGLARFDSTLTRKEWLRRGCWAMLMILAIAIYSFSNVYK